MDRRTPGPGPIAAIAAALAHVLDEDAGVLAERLAHDADAVGRQLQNHIAAMAQAQTSDPAPRVVLFVDQLEELITLSDEGEAAFASLALSSLLDAAPALRLIATARSDFLARLAALPGLGDAVTPGLYLCKPLKQHQIREAIVGPARLTGLRFESTAFVDNLVASVGSSAGELPLLQFALAQLWDSRDVPRNMICAASLQAMGGVAGALALHADSVLGLIPQRHLALARQLLTGLVTDDGTRARLDIDELRAKSGDAPHEAVRIVLETLVQGRLISVEDRGGTASYQIAHDVLVQGWGTLRGWRGGDVEREAARERLERAAAEWNRLGRPSEALWNRVQLAEVAPLATAVLGQAEADFVEQSRRSVRRRRLAGYAAATGIPALAALSTGPRKFVTTRAALRYAAGISQAPPRHIPLRNRPRRCSLMGGLLRRSLAVWCAPRSPLMCGGARSRATATLSMCRLATGPGSRA